LLLLVSALEEEPVTRVEAPKLAARLDPPAQPISSESLKEELARVVEQHPGDYGISVFHPASGESLSMDGDRTFTPVAWASCRRSWRSTGRPPAAR
jgi:hypothetical protein